MKNFIFILIIPTLIGCSTVDGWITDKTPDNPELAEQHKNAEPVNDGTGDVLIPNPVNPNEMIRTNLPPVVYKHELKPEAAEIVRTGSSLLPFPGARLVGEGIVGLGLLYTSIRNRKWKKAAISGVRAADQFRRALKKTPNGKNSDDEIKSDLKSQQRADGTWDMINTIINNFLK